MEDPDDSFLVENGFEVVRGADRTYFITPRPCRRRLWKMSEVATFLQQQHAKGQLLEVSAARFSIGKRKLQQASEEQEVLVPPTRMPTLVRVQEQEVVAAGGSKVDKMARLLTRDPEKKIDHRRELSRVAGKLDTWLAQLESGRMLSQVSSHLMERLQEAGDLEDVLSIMQRDPLVVDALAAEFSDVILAEIAAVDARQGPLGEFPPNINGNYFVRIVEYGMVKLPRLTAHLARLATRSKASLLPKDVLRIACALGNNIYLANKNIDGLVNLRSIMLQVGGLTDATMDTLSDMGMAETARGLNKQKDLFAEVGPKVMKATNRKMPVQSALDNMDIGDQHLMEKSSVRENVATDHLSTERMAKEEAVKMFKLELLLMGDLSLEIERDHLVRDVLANSWGRIVAGRRERAAKLLQFLPTHHRHALSGQPVQATISFVNKVYPCQETRLSHMIRLAQKVQREHLELVAESVDQDPVFLADLRLLEDKDADKAERVAAEARVHTVNQQFGEFIGHGDQLTVHMWTETKAICRQEVTAVGRLEFIDGPFRLEGLHSKMSKVAADYKELLHTNNYEDECTMAF
jgi:hypothetical protein